MALFTRQDLIAAIQDASLLALLDDSGTGEDSVVLAAIQAEAEEWVNGYLEAAGIGIPNPVPARLRFNAIKYAEYGLWRRRGADARAKVLYDDWIAPAAAWLERVALGEERLTAASASDLEAEAITEKSRLYNESGTMLL